MSAVRTAFVWIAFGVVCGVLALISILFTRLYTKKYERDGFVTVVSIFSISVVLATACLLPVDIAIVSQTTGMVAEELTRSELAVKIVYYLLYSMDAFLILILIPFTYFWFEEWDEESTTGGRIRGALKYSIIFIAIAVILLIVGFFIPYGRGVRDNFDSPYFRQLLQENRGERGLTFLIGVLLCLGIIVYVIYTAIGFAVLPVLCMKYRPSMSAIELDDARVSLELNREKQRMIEARYEGSSIQWSIRDKRAYEMLQREERTLIRRVRINGGGTHWYKPAWLVKSFRFVSRPMVILIGIVLGLIALLIIASIIISMVDHIMNTPCGRSCGFLLPKTQILNPINAILSLAARGFPADYVLTLFIIVWLFISTVIGLSYFSIRLVWFVLFRIQRGKTDPQGLLLGTAMLMVSVIAVNYAFTMVIAPDYARYGSQMFCDFNVEGVYGLVGQCEDYPDQLISCAEASVRIFTLMGDQIDPDWIVDPATELMNSTVYFNQVCRQTTVATFIDRVQVNFPWFGLFSFWAQFGFVGVFLVAAIVAIARRPSWDSYDADLDDEENMPEENRGLLSRTTAKWSNRLNTTWDDLTARAQLANQAVRLVT